MTGAGGEAAPRGYRIILPPGWVRIPLREGTQAALEELVYSRLPIVPQQIPRDRGLRYRGMVRQVLDEQVAAARRADGLDLYLPVRPRRGHRPPLPASFLVSRLVGPPSPTAGGTVTTARLAGTLAVRREYEGPERPDRQVPVRTRHVEYTLPVPHDPGRSLAVCFSTAGDGDAGSEFTAAVVELFDALMTTFRWSALSAPRSGSP